MSGNIEVSAGNGDIEGGSIFLQSGSSKELGGSVSIAAGVGSNTGVGGRLSLVGASESRIRTADTSALLSDNERVGAGSGYISIISGSSTYGQSGSVFIGSGESQSEKAGSIQLRGGQSFSGMGSNIDIVGGDVAEKALASIVGADANLKGISGGIGGVVSILAGEGYD